VCTLPAEIVHRKRGFVEVVFSTLISVPTGILTSFVFWWWVTRRLAPRIAWSSVLVIPPAATRTGTDHDQPRVKTVNLGRRDAVDLQVKAQLRVPHDVDNIGSPMSIVDLPTSVEWLPRLQHGSLRYVRLCLEQVPPAELRRVGAVVGRELAPGCGLAEFLQDHPDATVRLYLFAYDEFSGARKMFVSPDYGTSNMVEGSFRPGTSLTVDRADPDTPQAPDPDGE
jgi:hypothetical protein